MSYANFAAFFAWVVFCFSLVAIIGPWFCDTNSNYFYLWTSFSSGFWGFENSIAVVLIITVLFSFSSAMTASVAACLPKPHRSLNATLGFQLLIALLTLACWSYFISFDIPSGGFNYSYGFIFSILCTIFAIITAVLTILTIMARRNNDGSYGAGV